MGLSNGPNTITSGLVAVFDGANVRSFRGEPTTNVVTNTNLDTGWSKGYNTSIQWNDYPPPDGVNSQVVSFVDSNADGFGYWYSYGDYAPQDPNTTYTISIYARTVGSSWSLEAYTADNSETGRQWTNTLTVPGDGKWHRLVFNSFTTPANTQSDSLSFQFSSIPANQRCWLCAPQMEAKSYATPFVDGTRGTTNATGGGWVDLSGNGKHGELVNGPTYNSDKGGSIVFDGTNDYINLGNLGTIGNQQTIDVWFYSTSVTNYKNVLDMNYGNYGSTGNVGPRLEQSTGGASGWVWSGNTSNNSLLTGQSTTYSISANTWYNATWVNDNGTVAVYLNGVATQTGISSTYGFITTYGAASIGRGFHLDSSRYFAGRVGGVKIYSRALSAAEVSQNFNATRDRYGV